MIELHAVSMDFPVSRSLRDCVRHPLRKREWFPALEEVDLSIEQGARLALLGPNGAGKTTMLKLIGGQLLPTRGRIEVNGFDTARHPMAARRSVGFVMNEERSFFWRLTGRQNLVFFGALDNLAGEELSVRINELLELVGLREAADKPFAGYSSGMKQRLAMARGLLTDPEVLILDEPTRALDPIACDDLITLILERIHAQRLKTLLIATHRFDEVERLCDQVLVIHRGRVLTHDRVEALQAEERELDRYYRDHLHQVEEAPCC